MTAVTLHIPIDRPMLALNRRSEKPKEVREGNMSRKLRSELGNLRVWGIALIRHSPERRRGETDVPGLTGEAKHRPRVLLDTLVHPEEGTLGDGGTAEVVA